MKSAAIQPDFAYCPVFVLAAILTMSIAWANPMTAHEFENGFVERSIRISVRERIVTLEYSVGCNPVTMQDCLTRWASPNPAGPIVIENRYAKSISEPDSQPNEAPPLPDRFQAQLLKQIAQNIALRCDGQPLTWTPVSVTASSRHHVNAVATLRVELPKGNPLKLELLDPLFAEQSGEARYAAKSFGNVMMARSNVAPTIIRAKKVTLTELTTEQRLEKTKIECQLVFLSSDES